MSASESSRLSDSGDSSGRHRAAADESVRRRFSPRLRNDEPEPSRSGSALFASPAPTPTPALTPAPTPGAAPRATEGQRGDAQPTQRLTAGQVRDSRQRVRAGDAAKGVRIQASSTVSSEGKNKENSDSVRARGDASPTEKIAVTKRAAGQVRAPEKSRDAEPGTADSAKTAAQNAVRDPIVTGPNPDRKRRGSNSRVTRVKIETMGSRVKWAALAAAVVAVCAAAFGIKSLVSNSPDTGSREAVSAFAAAWGRQDAAAAGSYTTAPGQASEALTQTLQGMNAQSVDVAVEKPVEYSDGTASFSLKATWKFDSDRSYTTESSGTARHLSTGWKVAWEPSVIYPDMPVGGYLREIRTDATPAPTVNSRSGKTFMYLQPVNEVILDPGQTKNVQASARALADTLAPIAPLVTTSVINEKLAASQGKAVTTVTLRDSDMKVLTKRPDSVSGVTVRKAGMLVMADRRLNSPLEPGLTNYWQAIRDATAGWQVQLVGPGISPRKLGGEQGPAGPDMSTTIDQGVQLSLGDAAVEVGQPATIMALDAKTGGILGMAQNTYAADNGTNIDTPYSVGSTLDPVLTAVDKGARDNQETSESILHRLGLGVQFTIPGASAPTFSDPNASTIDLHKTGLKLSMSNMAALGVAMARSQAGTMTSVAPYVIKGADTKTVGGQLGELDSNVTSAVWKSMTATAKSGDASDLTKASGLRALVGTNGPEGPGWFVGVQGGKVIVIYTEGAKSGTAALQVAQKYFSIK